MLLVIEPVMHFFKRLTFFCRKLTVYQGFLCQNRLVHLYFEFFDEV